MDIFATNNMMVKSKEELVNKILFGKLQSFDDACHDFVRGLDSFTFNSPRFKAIVEDYKRKMNNYSDQIFTHQKLDDTEIVTKNFFDTFNSFFDSAQFDKGVEYYIKNGLEADPVLVEDEATLRQEFVIPYCLNSIDLVTLNVASNARKYSPNSSKVMVTLTNEDTYKYIEIVNYGPKCDDSEIDALSGDFKRGQNADYIAGMGLGASQIRSIIHLHKKMIDAEYHFRSSKNVVMMDGIPFSTFTTTISYNTVLQDDDLEGQIEEVKRRIPLIILHNMGGIVSNILFATNKLFSVRYRGDEEWRRYLSIQISNINDIQDTIRMCLYIECGFSTEYLLGNTCSVDVEKVLENTLNYLCERKYKNKNITLKVKGGLYIVESYSALYSILYGLCDVICASLPKYSTLYLEMDEKSQNVIFSCNSVDFQHVIKEPMQSELLECISIENLPKVKLHMYGKLFDELSCRCLVNNNMLELMFEDYE